MPIADTDVRWVKPPKLGLLDRLYLPAIFEGHDDNHQAHLPAEGDAAIPRAAS